MQPCQCGLARISIVKEQITQQPSPQVFFDMRLGVLGAVLGAALSHALFVMAVMGTCTPTRTLPCALLGRTGSRDRT